MLGAMRFVVAKKAIAEPKQLSSAAEVCPGVHKPAVAVLPVAASSPSGAKVRQVRHYGHAAESFCRCCLLHAVSFGLCVQPLRRH